MTAKQSDSEFNLTKSMMPSNIQKVVSIQNLKLQVLQQTQAFDSDLPFDWTISTIHSRREGGFTNVRCYSKRKKPTFAFTNIKYKHSKQLAYHNDQLTS